MFLDFPKVMMIQARIKDSRGKHSIYMLHHSTLFILPIPFLIQPPLRCLKYLSYSSDTEDLSVNNKSYRVTQDGPPPYPILFG